MLLILNITPHKIIQGTKRTYFKICQRVNSATASYILKSSRNSADALHHHAFLMPVTPDKFKKNREFEFRCKKTITCIESRLKAIINVLRKGILKRMKLNINVR